MDAIRCQVPGHPTILCAASLPADLLGLVLAHLTPDDLLAVSAVCRTWHRAASADALWARHLAPLVQPLETPDMILAMQKAGTLAPLSLREHHALCKSMGKKISCFMGAEWRHLCVVRQAARHGFDPLRHIAPSWTNAMRLLCLFVFCGTPALTAVADTCRTHSSFACRRGRKFRALFRRTLYLAPSLTIAFCAACVLMVALFRPAWLARFAALSTFLATLALVLACHVNDAGSHAPLYTALMLSYLPFMWSSGAYLPWSLAVAVCRLVMGVAAGVPYKRLDLSPYNQLITCAMFAMFDFVVPLLLVDVLAARIADVRRLRRSVFRVLQCD